VAERSRSPRLIRVKFFTTKGTKDIHSVEKSSILAAGESAQKFLKISDF